MATTAQSGAIMTSSASDSKQIVVVDYADLVVDPGCGDSSSSAVAATSNAALLKNLKEAFGAGSLGIVAIRGVPRFLEAREQFLPMGHALAHLPVDVLEKELTNPATLYNSGWSHGKEKLGDKPDYAKGSFYFNPLSDLPGTPELREKFPLSYPCNVWPDDETIPGFQSAAKNIGSIMHGAVVHLARHIDALAEEQRGAAYSKNLLFDAMKATDKAKGRLLYYFPIEENPSNTGSNSKKAGTTSEDSWIGWHCDSGFLTALAGDIYVDDETGNPIDRSLVDPSAGLYAVDRDGNTVKVDIPEDCMAVQIGECTQIVTGGAVIATPHCVRGGGLVASKKSGDGPGECVKVARISLPCFIDTGPTFALNLPVGCRPDEAIVSGVGTTKVPPLQDRWTDGVSFGDFLSKTFAMYYDWSMK